jgi:hypothetical protein
MLDYYGSIMMSIWDISNNISQTPKYKMYSKIYIFEVVNYLFMKNILSDSYSVTGWNMFHKKDAINHIDNYIRLNTTKCKKIFALMLQLTNNTDLVYEPLLYKKICDNIKINYMK